jgi:hypothetical protein
VDDHGWREILARNQENAGIASVISLGWAAGYAIVKRLDVWSALSAALVGALAAATLWIFLAESFSLKLIIVVPLGVGCGIGAFPLLKAYTRRDDAIADGVLSTAEGWLSRFLKKREK